MGEYKTKAKTLWSEVQHLQEAVHAAKERCALQNVRRDICKVSSTLPRFAEQSNNPNIETMPGGLHHRGVSFQEYQDTTSTIDVSTLKESMEDSEDNMFLTADMLQGSRRSSS